MRTSLLVTVLLAAICVAVYALQPPAADLVVYCAHDSVYSSPFLHRFTEETGITLDVRYDTEASKSLGLTQLIERERERPRCDVLWNNEVLGTAHLASQGLLVPYAEGVGFRRIPVGFKDPKGHWVGFAARLRVWIVHTPSLENTTAAIDAARHADNLEGFAMARPLYGTTRTHVTALWESLGAEPTRELLADLRRRGARVVRGNATVKNLVARGACTFGWTDTDDYFVAKDAGLPVAMLPITLADDRTICIPNTAAIVKGCRRLDAARKLVDYLASARSEVALANSASRQVPLGDVELDRLPAEVRELTSAARRGYVFSNRDRTSADCLRWLQDEFLR